MTIGRCWGIVPLVVTLLCLFTATAIAQPLSLTARELVENTRLKEHIPALKDGEIVILNQPEKEKANQLNVSMALLVPASLQTTVATLQRQSTAEDAPGVLAGGELPPLTAAELDGTFAGIAFTSQETKEVGKMMAVGPGADFNFSRDEIARVIQAAESLQGADRIGPAAIDAMSAAMRAVLMGRYRAYQKQGLAGLAPYQVGPSKQINPSQELISATDDLQLVKERFPDYHGSLRYYPQNRPTGLAHHFLWAKQTEAGRPLFLLKHWILDVKPDYALITERRFYLNHSLNSLQVVIGCLPHRDSTLVVLLNQAFTEKVNMTVGKTIAKAIGYRAVEKNIRPIFENLRTALGR